jgi:hypothetical protein
MGATRMYAGNRHVRQATRTALIVLGAAILISRLAYSEGAVSTQVDMAIRQAVEDLPRLYELEVRLR